MEVDFDWQSNRVRNTAKGQTWEMAVPDGTLDKFSYLLAMMRDLNTNKQPLRYDIADGGSLKLYELTILGRETITTVLGALETVRIRRKNRKSRTTTLWCATRLAHLPVRIEHSEKDGSTVTLELQEVTGLTLR